MAPEGSGVLGVKVYLDDERPTPEGWVRAYTVQETIDLLKTGLVTELSLDHDLGDLENGTGYDVILWIEEAVYLHHWVPTCRMSVHSANPIWRMKMEAGIRQIEKRVREESHMWDGKKPDLDFVFGSR